MTTTTKMELGQVVMTRGVADEVAKGNVTEADIERILHAQLSHNWGELDEEDKAVQRASLTSEHSERIMGVHTVKAENRMPVKLWIITEWDRSVTTILLPSEY